MNDNADTMPKSKRAVLFRMVTDEDVCPFGVKAKALLERKGFEVDDRHLTSKEANEDFIEEEGVESTPQAYIDGKRMGGYDDLREHFEGNESEREASL